jgi:DNA-nicking Smr family endonuclease
MGEPLKKLARLACIASIASLGCKPPTPDEQLDNVRSWLATADMTAQAWVNHTTPERYTRQTLELAHTNVEQITEELLKSRPPGLDSASLDSVLTRSGSRIDQMQRLVKGRNAPDLRIQLDSLRVEERSVHEFSDRVKSGQ